LTSVLLPALAMADNAVKRQRLAEPALPELRTKCRTPAVSDLVFGGGVIGCVYADVPEKQAQATVEAALAAGITRFDTAPWYGAGLSELRLGRFLEGKSEVVLSTKCGRIIKPLAETDPKTDRVERHYIGHFITDAYHADIPVAAYTAEGVRESFRQSCARLCCQRIECLRLHDAEDEERFKEATEGGGIEAMLELKRQGLVAEVGLGMNNAAFALKYLRKYPKGTFDSLMLAGCWNLLDQDGLEVLRECQHLEVPVINVGIFASGILWGTANYKYQEAPAEVSARVARWRELVEEFGLSLPQVALAFALLPEAVQRVAVGCGRPEEVAGNIALCGASVPPALWQRARAAGLLPEDLPLPGE